MRSSTKTEIRVGITVFVSIILLIWIFGWAKNISFSSGEKELLARFGNVAGLEDGAVVSINGVNKGYVEEIKNVRDSVIVKMKIEPGVLISDDARFYVMMLDLMGGKKVEISPGKSGNEINYNRIHPGKFRGDAATAFATLYDMQDDIVGLVNKVDTSITLLNKMLGNEKIFGEAEDLLVRLNRLSGKLEKVVDDNDENITELIGNSNDLAVSLKEVLDENRQPLGNTIQRLDTLTVSTSRLLTEVEQVVKKLNSTDNSVGYMLNDKEMVENIKEISEKLKTLSDILIEQLQDDGVKVDADIL